MVIPYIGPELVEALMTDNYSTAPTTPTILKRSPTTPIKCSHASVLHLWAGMALRGALIIIALFSLLLL
jgi:quinol-cytochrome oxidoreductase complex cytochrome b subunit